MLLVAWEQEYPYTLYILFNITTYLEENKMKIVRIKKEDEKAFEILGTAHKEEMMKNNMKQQKIEITKTNRQVMR